MGDASTHLIFYSGYWYLVSKDDYGKGLWISTAHRDIVCPVGSEEKILDLKEVS